jgi:hypothetical protein
MNHLLPRSLLVLSLGSALCAQAARTGPRSLEDVLPASTYAVARFGGLDACRDAAHHQPMAAVVDAFLAKLPPEVRAQFVDAQLDRASDQLQQGLQQAGMSPADMRAVLSRPMALALGRLTVEGHGPSVALLVDAGDAAPAIDRLLAAIEAQGSHQGLQLAWSDVEIGSAKVRRAQGPAEMPALFVGHVGGCFVLSNSRGYLREIDLVAQGKQPALTAASDLGTLARRLPQPALASLFLNTKSLSSMFDAHLPYEAAAFGDALGLGHLDSLYLGTTAATTGGCDLIHIGLQGNPEGLVKALHSKPADLSFARLCSQNTIVFGAGSLDVPAVVDAFDRLLDLLPAEAREEMQREMKRELRRELGTTPQEADAVLRAFGNQVGFAIGLEKGAVPKPELLVRLVVRDAARVAPLLQKLEAAVVREAGVEWKTRMVGEASIRFCNLEVPDANFQLSPCYVQAGNDLLFGSDVAALVRALKQGDKQEESFAAQPDYAVMAADCKGASGVLHLRLFRAVELGWRSLETWAYPQVDAHKDEIGFGSEALPDAEAMAKALGTSTFVHVVDGSGMTWRSTGTFGLGGLLAAFGAAADEVLHRACGKVY